MDSSLFPKFNLIKVGPQVDPGTRFSCPYFLSAAKGRILDAMELLPEKKREQVLESGNIVETKEVGDFLWHCTQQPNEDEISITKRKENSEMIFL